MRLDFAFPLHMQITIHISSPHYSKSKHQVRIHFMENDRLEISISISFLFFKNVGKWIYTSVYTVGYNQILIPSECPLGMRHLGQFMPVFIFSTSLLVFHCTFFSVYTVIEYCRLQYVFWFLWLYCTCILLLLETVKPLKLPHFVTLDKSVT